MKRVGCIFYHSVLFAAMVSVSAASPAESSAQAGGGDADVVVDPALYQVLEYRLIGPYRGGRSTAVAGVPSQPHTFYMGTGGGGVWKTTDSGESWKNLSDKYFGAGSMGAIAVAESDPNIVYAGTGDACIRGNISPGVGVYKSTDAGRTWEHMGLGDAGQIGRIRIHPEEPDLVYVAVLGHAFGPNELRGVFRSKDGGKNWEKVLYVSPKAGAVDLAMDANNPSILYASIWRAERKPWKIISGGEEGGLYKTTDGGDRWEKFTNGLPIGVVGRIGVAVSPANSARVWALVEAEKGGVYRSEDGGESFRLVNDEARLQDRAWFYMHIFADPKDENTVYVLNNRFYKSVDGGRTYETVPTPHGDNHDLWINPTNPEIMVNGNDGGGNVSHNGGKSWSTQLNQPMTEFYRLAVDNQFPYRVYGSPQDGRSISLPSRIVSSQAFEAANTAAGISLQDWTETGGGESGHIAVDPRNANIIYAGTYGGIITRVDKEAQDLRIIMPYPQLAMGQAAKDLKYRFAWNAPVRLSPHNPDVVYMTSQHVHRSPNQGQSWDVISPDLTRDDKSKQEVGGGPIQKEAVGAEVYGSIFAFEESPQMAGLLWVGTDDGLVHISKDGGRGWEDVTPKGMPEWGTVNHIELSAHDSGRAFLAVHRYRLDDFNPYIFRTNDYGRSWELLTDGRNGIPANHFVRVVREDPDRKGLLYAGTEFGMYVSFDDGQHWQPLQLNLPVTPIADMAVHEKDLVVATHGRSFWILDNLTPLHQITEEVVNSEVYLFKPRDVYRLAVEGGPLDDYMVRDSHHGALIPRDRVGKNAPVGAMIFYYLVDEVEEEVVLEIVDSGGNVIRTFSSSEEEVKPSETTLEVRKATPRVSVKAGLNLFVWDLHYLGPEIIKGAAFWMGTNSGPRAVPGTYQVRLRRGDWSQTQSFELTKNPRLRTTQVEYQKQFELAMQIRDEISRLYHAVHTIRNVREEVNDRARRLKEVDQSDEAVKVATSLSGRLTEIEQELMQTNTTASPIINPPKLGGQFVDLYGMVANAEARPTDEEYRRFEDLKSELTTLLARLREVTEADLAAFREMVQDKGSSR